MVFVNSVNPHVRLVLQIKHIVQAVMDQEELNSFTIRLATLIVRQDQVQIQHH